ncbi:hypothetical protein KP79_PYT04264 [Mizuhopecten yessoensis]|uniref:EF-hand domain-containing protein n=1 Tax=Mizuhopecten yessoensis TaxID=6573 RepID=A0A210PTU1_MIZYE|nr:hypothetical protein KP79_PYT04264 [Mizuhopecten yessoensis]
MARSSILLLALANSHSHGHHGHAVDYTHYVDELWTNVNYDHDTLHFTTVELHDFLVFADTNKDGSITRHEYVTAATKDAPDLTAFSHGLFDTFDANNDHHLTLDDTTALYDRMDSDGDGFITKPEFYTFWTNVLTSLAHTHGNGNLLG